MDPSKALVKALIDLCDRCQTTSTSVGFVGALFYSEDSIDADFALLIIDRLPHPLILLNILVDLVVHQVRCSTATDFSLESIMHAAVCQGLALRQASVGHRELSLRHRDLMT